jgi:hypothetical protein
LPAKRFTDTGVVDRVEHRLGQQPDRAHRRLQLVAHVGHEVPPGGLEAHGVGHVRGLDEGEPVAQRPHHGDDGGGLAAAHLQRGEVHLDVGRALEHLLAGRPGAGVGPAGADHAELGGPPVVQDDVAGAGEHGEPGPGRPEDALEELGQRRHPPAVRPGPGGPGAAAADQDTGPQPGGEGDGDQHDGRHCVHTGIVGSPTRADASSTGPE